MELVVAVSKIEIEGVERFDLRCRAEARGEIKTESVTVALVAGRKSGSCPTFKFSFTGSSPNAALQFAAFNLTGASELGSCHFPISLQGSNVLSEQAISKQTKVALLSSKIEGTDVQKFVGKIWFRVTPNFQTQPTPLPNIENFISREAENKCTAHLPCDTPTVSVVFHCINSANLAKSSEHLRLIACIGSGSNLSIDTILHETDGQHLTATPILCPITLRCSQHQNIELHIADKAEGTLVFSSSHPISSLTPFVHSHTRYTRESMSGNEVSSLSHIPENHEPSILISLVYSVMLERDMMLCKSPTVQGALCPSHVHEERRQDTVAKEGCVAHGNLTIDLNVRSSDRHRHEPGIGRGARTRKEGGPRPPVRPVPLRHCRLRPPQDSHVRRRRPVHRAPLRARRVPRPLLRVIPAAPGPLPRMLVHLVDLARNARPVPPLAVLPDDLAERAAARGVHVLVHV